MKSHFSIIVGILLGVILSLGFGSVSLANPPQKGIITVGLIRGLGINMSPNTGESSELAAKTPSRKAVHQANVIPTTVSGSEIRQTSGELTNDSLAVDLGNSGEMSLDLAPAAAPDQEMTLDEPEIDLADTSFPDELPTSNSMEISEDQTVENLSVLDGENKNEPSGPQEGLSDISLAPLAEQEMNQEMVPASAPMVSPLENPASTNDFAPLAESSNPTSVNELKKAESTDFPADFGSVSATEGSGKPGEAAIEGVQLSRLSIQKVAPEEIQVGQPATWTISVRNESKITAIGVQIHDVIPQGARLESTNPPAQVSENGEITWTVGNMPSGTMATVKLELTPTREGEIGSVASVTSRSESSAKSIATRPMLKVETFGDAVVLLGNKTELSIVVSNPGTGTARDVILSETVPPELQFDGGTELRYEVGDLRAGESKTVKLPLTAVRPGKFQNRILAKSGPNLGTASSLEMEVTAPAIQMEIQGPSKRFLDKEGTFRLIATNTGTAAAKNLEMQARIPNGWQFLSANHLGTYMQDNQTVVWKLEELDPAATAEAELVLVPKEIGSFAMSYSAVADSCQTVNGTKNLTVEGIAALMFQVVDSNDPVQVGEETKYTVEVVNQGSKPAEDVQVTIDIPSGLQIVSSEETARSVSLQGGSQIVFQPISSLAPKATKVYRFTLKGITSGDQRVVVKLSSREFQTPIIKEESTRVFAE
ncbi:MAG: DUF11 domain-containing protein [Thermoguttaceae bacterium]|nr:DUF11 domain-containing protein [Thermoguttaceae bacterium]